MLWLKNKLQKLNKNIFLGVPFQAGIIILCLVMFIGFTFTAAGCSNLLSSTGEKIDVGSSDQETGQGLEGSAGDTSAGEENAETAAETLPEIDFANIQVGADMIGEIPSYLCTNRDNFLKIQITNTSNFAWSPEGSSVVRIGYHYYGQDVDFVDYDRTQRSLLSRVVNPGDSIKVLVEIDDVKNPGSYVIQIDPVLEGNSNPDKNFWFSSKGVKMLEGLVFFSDCAK